MISLKKHFYSCSLFLSQLVLWCQYHIHTNTKEKCSLLISDEQCYFAFFAIVKLYQNQTYLFIRQCYMSVLGHTENLKIHIAATPLHHYNIHIIIHSDFMQDRRATLSMQSVCWSCSVIFVAWFTVLDEQNSARDRSLQPITFSAHLIMRCSGFISAATSDDDRRCDYTFAFDKMFD